MTDRDDIVFALVCFAALVAWAVHLAADCDRIGVTSSGTHVYQCH